MKKEAKTFAILPAQKREHKEHEAHKEVTNTLPGAAQYFFFKKNLVSFVLFVSFVFLFPFLRPSNLVRKEKFLSEHDNLFEKRQHFQRGGVSRQACWRA